MIIDMHAHWRPPALIHALRQRTAFPNIVTNDEGLEVLRNGTGEKPVADSFDDLEERLVEMDEHGITTAVLSLSGRYQWIEARPIEESVPLTQLYNDNVSAICRDNPGRFLAYASLPLIDLAAAIKELDRAMALPGIIGAILPGNAFLDLKRAEEYTPLLEAADRLGAVIFVHFGPRPGDDWPRTASDSDNFRRRMGTLDMQASLSSNMVTFCFTDYLDAFPNVNIHVQNLGGNIPYELERMDHRCLLDTPNEELPSTRVDKPNLYVDCNSFGRIAIEAGVAAYGEERILFGTDGSGFGCEWSKKAIAESNIGEDARQAILYKNAAQLLSSHLDSVSRPQAAE